MSSRLTQLREALARCLRPFRWWDAHSRPAPPHPTYPYSCVYVHGPTAHRTGSLPPRGEDSPLVRPYLLAHERRTVARRALRIVGPGADIGALPTLPAGVAR
ncbi:hypothetical protein ABZ567_04340 [Streptomyces sp. NPDC016459]|uniref:hypothetical protein n=1 Tax=Streptomyces sp. NPDC016459 TaxID=3157190 RepID=UPI00340337BA